MKNKTKSILIFLVLVIGSASLMSFGTAYDEPQEAGPGWVFKTNYTNYAPEGMPDFDQKNTLWESAEGNYTHCGPVAVANCLWWMDSKYSHPNGTPGDGSDIHSLVTKHASQSNDDHEEDNVIPLVNTLATYINTTKNGTEVHDLINGLEEYFVNQSKDKWYNVSYYNNETVTFDVIYDKINQSYDVILLLGFWQYTGESWLRLGGHYVTVCGVNNTEDPLLNISGCIAICDPYLDNAEAGGMGWISTHDPHPGDATSHFNTSNVSHDYYFVANNSTSPGSDYCLIDYPVMPVDILDDLQYQNEPSEFDDFSGWYSLGEPVQTEIEYIIVVEDNPYNISALGGGYSRARTFDDAIATVSVGDTIEIMDGYIYDNVTITQPNLTIYGNHSMYTYINGDGSNDYIIHNTVAEGLNLSYINLIHNNSMTTEGIRITNSYSVLVNRINVTLCGSYGLRTNGLLTHNVVISNSEFYDCAWGVYTGDSSYYLDFVNCTFNKNDYDGVRVSNSNYTNFTSCYFLGSTGSGVVGNGINLASGSENVTLESCELYNNNMNGLRIDDSKGALIANSTIYSNTDNGVYIVGAYHPIFFNVTIYSNGDDGIACTGAERAIEISYSNIYSNDNVGIGLLNTPAVIDNTDIYDNFANINVSNSTFLNFTTVNIYNATGSHGCEITNSGNITFYTVNIYNNSGAGLVGINTTEFNATGMQIYYNEGNGIETANTTLWLQESTVHTNNQSGVYMENMTYYPNYLNNLVIYNNTLYGLNFNNTPLTLVYNITSAHGHVKDINLVSSWIGFYQENYSYQNCFLYEGVWTAVGYDDTLANNVSIYINGGSSNESFNILPLKIIPLNITDAINLTVWSLDNVTNTIKINMTLNQTTLFNMTANITGYQSNTYDWFDNISSVNFTFTNLTADTNYTIKVDEVNQTVKQSNATGIIMWNYTGNWSEHQFELLAEGELEENTCPTLTSLVYPSNQSTITSWNGTNGTVHLKVILNDTEGDTITVYFYNQTGVTAEIDNVTVSSGAVAWVNWTNLANDSTYNWSISAVDEHGCWFTNLTYNWTFDTGATITTNNPPTVELKKPTLSSTPSWKSESAKSINISVYANDSNGDTLTVYFMRVTLGGGGLVYTTINTTTCDANSTPYFIWTGLSYDTSYNWSVNVTDGTGNVSSSIWGFTTPEEEEDDDGGGGGGSSSDDDDTTTTPPPTPGFESVILILSLFVTIIILIKRNR